MSPCSASSFPPFALLPTELRLMTWRMAFDDVGPAVSICHFSENRPRVSVAHPHAAALGFLPPVASVCWEAMREWLRLTRRSRSSASSLDRVYAPRTIFLVHTSAILQSHLTGLASLTAHIAFDIADCPDVLSVFEALAQFPQLETIIPIIPSEAMTEEQIAQRKENLHRDPCLLRRMVALIDGPSPDGEWHRETYVGWLLRNELDGEQVRRFYSRNNSPHVKLLIDKPRTSRSAAEDNLGPWSLVLY